MCRRQCAVRVVLQPLVNMTSKSCKRLKMMLLLPSYSPPPPLLLLPMLMMMMLTMSCHGGVPPLRHEERDVPRHYHNHVNEKGEVPELYEDPHVQVMHDKVSVFDKHGAADDPIMHDVDNDKSMVYVERNVPKIIDKINIEFHHQKRNVQTVYKDRDKILRRNKKRILHVEYRSKKVQLSQYVPEEQPSHSVPVHHDQYISSIKKHGEDISSYDNVETHNRKTSLHSGNSGRVLAVTSSEPLLATRRHTGNGTSSSGDSSNSGNNENAASSDSYNNSSRRNDSGVSNNSGDKSKSDNTGDSSDNTGDSSDTTSSSNDSSSGDISNSGNNENTASSDSYNNSSRRSDSGVSNNSGDRSISDTGGSSSSDSRNIDSSNDDSSISDDSGSSNSDKSHSGSSISGNSDINVISNSVNTIRNINSSDKNDGRNITSSSNDTSDISVTSNDSGIGSTGRSNDSASEPSDGIIDSSGSSDSADDSKITVGYVENLHLIADDNLQLTVDGSSTAASNEVFEAIVEAPAASNNSLISAMIASSSTAARNEGSQPIVEAPAAGNSALISAIIASRFTEKPRITSDSIGIINNDYMRGERLGTTNTLLKIVLRNQKQMVKQLNQLTDKMKMFQNSFDSRNDRPCQYDSQPKTNFNQLYDLDNFGSKHTVPEMFQLLDRKLDAIFSSSENRSPNENINLNKFHESEEAHNKPNTGNGKRNLLRPTSIGRNQPLLPLAVLEQLPRTSDTSDLYDNNINKFGREKRSLENENDPSIISGGNVDSAMEDPASSLNKVPTIHSHNNKQQVNPIVTNHLSSSSSKVTNGAFVVSQSSSSIMNQSSPSVANQWSSKRTRHSLSGRELFSPAVTRPWLSTHWTTRNTSDSSSRAASETPSSSSSGEVVSLVRWLVRQQLSYNSHNRVLAQLLNALNLRHNLSERNILKAMAAAQSDSARSFVSSHQSQHQMLLQIAESNSKNITQVILEGISDAATQLKIYIDSTCSEVQNVSLQQHSIISPQNVHSRTEMLTFNVNCTKKCDTATSDRIEKRNNRLTEKQSNTTIAHGEELNTNNSQTTKVHSQHDYADINDTDNIYNENMMVTTMETAIKIETFTTIATPTQYDVTAPFSAIISPSITTVPSAIPPSIMNNISVLHSSEQTLSDTSGQQSKTNTVSFEQQYTRAGEVQHTMDDFENNTADQLQTTTETSISTPGPVPVHPSPLPVLIQPSRLLTLLQIDKNYLNLSLEDAFHRASKTSPTNCSEHHQRREIRELLHNLTDQMTLQMTRGLRYQNVEDAMSDRLRGLEEQLTGLKIYLDATALRLRTQIEDAISTAEAGVSGSVQTLLVAVDNRLQRTLQRAQNVALKVADAAVTSVSSAAVASGRHTTDKLATIVSNLLSDATQQLTAVINTRHNGCPERYTRIGQLCLLVPDVHPPPMPFLTVASFRDMDPSVEYLSPAASSPLENTLNSPHNSVEYFNPSSASAAEYQHTASSTSVDYIPNSVEYSSAPLQFVDNPPSPSTNSFEGSHPSSNTIEYSSPSLNSVEYSSHPASNMEHVPSLQPKSGYNWSEARTICRSYEGDLAVLPESTDFTPIFLALRHVAFSADCSDGCSAGFWIGAKSRMKGSLSHRFSDNTEVRRKLKWVTGDYSDLLTVQDKDTFGRSTVSDYLTYSRISFRNPWNVETKRFNDLNSNTENNEPDEGEDQNRLECLLLVKESSFKLVLEDCNAKHNALCQYIPTLA